MVDESFSDKEVSLILRRAAEIEASGKGTSGMTASDIEAIALEAGIEPTAVRLAMEELRVEPSGTARSWIALASRREARVVPTELGRDQLAALMRAVEKRVGRPGSVTEALGTVRWSSTAGLWATDVSVTARDGETRIGVHERIVDDKRKLFQILPPAWGAMAGMIVAGALAVGGLGIIGLTGGGALLGLGIGRAIYRSRSEASGERVERIALALAEDARVLGRGEDREDPESSSGEIP